MSTNKRFLAKNGVDNNNNTITNVNGIEGAGNITLSRAGSTMITLGASDVNIANNLTISNASARAYIDAQGGSPQTQFLRSGVLDALIGTASTTNNTITGSSAGDLCLRAANNDILLSTDDGASAQLALTSQGRTGLGSTSPYTKLHVRISAVSGLSSVNNEGILIERGGGVAALNIASDNTQSGAIWFADPESLTAGGFQYLHASDTMTIRTNSGEKLRISSTGNLGIASTNPQARLHVVGNSGQARFDNTSASDARHEYHRNGVIEGMIQWDANLMSIGAIQAAGALTFWAGGNGAEKMRIDSAGRVMIGVSASRTNGGISAVSQIEGTTSSAAIALARNSADATGPYLMIGKTRSATNGGSTLVQSGDVLGTIQFNGSDGNDLSSAGAAIQCRVDNTPGLDDMPGRLVFMTTPDGSNGPTERMRIDSAGNVSIGGVSPTVRLRVFGNSGQLLDIDGSATTTGAVDSGAGISFTGHDGTSARTFAQIYAGKVNGTVSDYASYLAFSTRTNGGPLGVERMRIDNTGKVGIGTTNPDGLLHLSGTSAAPAVLIFERSDGAIGSRNWFQRIRSNHTFDIGKADDSGTITNTYFSIDTNGFVDIPMQLSLGGNIGIGTSLPQAKQHTRVVSDTASEVARFETINTALTDNAYLKIVASSTDNLVWYDSTGTSAGAHAWFSGGTERMRMTSGGNLLIGTATDDNTNKLQVNGNGIRIATAQTPASATATGVAGTIAWDSNYVYVCVATNTWKRSALSTW
jgi:hypothetical protein